MPDTQPIDDNPPGPIPPPPDPVPPNTPHITAAATLVVSGVVVVQLSYS